SLGDLLVVARREDAGPRLVAEFLQELRGKNVLLALDSRPRLERLGVTAVGDSPEPVLKQSIDLPPVLDGLGLLVLVPEPQRRILLETGHAEAAVPVLGAR